MTLSQPWPIRAVQLDLARQMETPATIHGFIDFASRVGYNFLHLYLEGRVRTASFPYPDPESSYSLDDMREIVAYAAARGMTVVPQVNCLAHAEQFLRHRELAALGELREGCTGRFGQSRQFAFCPSLAATGDFLEQYLGELATAFPGPHFAVGLDEVWDMGICSACRARLAAGEGLDDLFAAHVERLHRIVTGKLGKRLWLWDDMFEEYPRALDRLPPDVVLLVWQYDNQVASTRTHFGRRRSDWRLADYDRRGLAYLIAPAPWSLLNASSFTAHARHFHPLGGLMTVWGLHDSFLLELYPCLALAGRLWSDPHGTAPETLFKMAAAELFGLNAPLFLQALCLQQARSRTCRVGKLIDLLRGPLTPREQTDAMTAELLLTTLAPFAGQLANALAEAVLADILLRLRRQLVEFRLRQLLEAAYTRWSSATPTATAAQLAEAAELNREIAAIREARAAQWQCWRPGLRQEDGRPLDSAFAEQVTAFTARLAAGGQRLGVLTVHYALPDFFGAQRVIWQAQFADQTDWVNIWEGVPKPRAGVDDEVPFYQARHPLPDDRRPLRLRVISYGYGGIGLAWLELHVQGQCLRPSAVREVLGQVEQPEAILNRDTAWCQLGDADTQRAMHDPARAASRSQFVIELQCAADWA